MLALRACKPEIMSKNLIQDLNSDQVGPSFIKATLGVAKNTFYLETGQGQNCPPHSPEETYKRQASFQFRFIHFFNGCSARDTRPQNLTRVLFNKSSLC